VQEVILGLNLVGYLIWWCFELLCCLPLRGSLVLNWQLLAQLLLQLLLLELDLKVLVLLLQMLGVCIVHVHVLHVRNILVHQDLLVAVCDLA
jgi:hypothetical protein